MTLSRNCVTAALAALVAASSAAALAADGMARLPRPRPATELPQATADWVAAAPTHFADARSAIDGIARLPRPRPLGAATLAMVSPEPDAPAPVPPTATPPLPALSDADFAACLGDLRELGVTFETVAPMGEGGCAVQHPLRVTSLGSGVEIGPETILNCTTTRALATWVRDVVLPASLRTLGERPTAIRQDSTYVCRNRNNDPNAKVSEHAHANAIDIADFAFSDRADVGIGRSDAGSPEAAFEAGIREGACQHFTTVLGPGSNAEHATHFHLDLAARRGGYRLCDLEPPKIARGPENTARE